MRTPNPVEFATRANAVEARLLPLGRFIERFGEALDPPILYRSARQNQGFRYLAPDARHFCLLKGARAVSGMNASALLARGGYPQEIAVLIRTVVECTSHIDFILLSAGADGTMSPGAAATFMRKYFADYQRDEPTDYRKAPLPQEKVHRSVGDWLDIRARAIGLNAGTRAMHELMWNVYLRFSAYVHARYPEAIDLYGGNPGQFHPAGMRGTPKDGENLDIIETFITTVSQSLAHVALHFELGFVGNDPILRPWAEELELWSLL